MTITSLVLWGIFTAYWLVGIKRIPTYYRRWYDVSKKEYRFMSEQEHQRSGAWHAIGLAAIWPYYESARWLRDSLIHALTADERRQKEYEAAAKIVADYKARKDREEREAFDRELDGR